MIIMLGGLLAALFCGSAVSPFAGIALAHLRVANEETFRFFKAETIPEIPGHGYIGSFTI